jgi:hypothetical protein
MQFCDLYKVGEEFAPRPLALAVGKKNRLDLLSMLNPAIQKLEIEGRIEELQVKYWTGSGAGQQLNCEEFRKLNNGISLLNAGGVFLVIGCGLVLTLCILTLENMILLQLKVSRAKQARCPPLPRLPERRLRKYCLAPFRIVLFLLTGSRSQS